MKHDYTKLDALILERLRITPASFAEMMTGALEAEAKHLEAESATEWGYGGKCAMRFLDGRLQALRKRGEISYRATSL